MASPPLIITTTTTTTGTTTATTTTSTDTVNPGAVNPGASSTTTATATTLVSDHHQHHRGGRDYSQSFGEHGRLDRTATTATEAATAIKIDTDRIRFHSTAACCYSQTTTTTAATTTTTSTDKYLYLIRDILHSPSIHSIRSNSVCSAAESVVSSSPNHHCSLGDAWSPARRLSLEKEEETTIINMMIPIQKQQQQEEQADDRNHRGQPESACCLRPMMAVDQENADNNDEPQPELEPESGAFTNTHHHHQLHLENIAEMDPQKSPRRTQNGNGPMARFYDYLHRISRYVKCSDILVLLALFIFTMILILILRPVPNDLRSILLFILIWLSTFILYRLFPTFKRWFYYWNPGFTLYKPC